MCVLDGEEGGDVLAGEGCAASGFVGCRGLAIVGAGVGADAGTDAGAGVCVCVGVGDGDGWTDGCRREAGTVPRDRNGDGGGAFISGSGKVDD